MHFISPELQKVLQDCDGSPLRLVDPATKQEYVLLRTEVFDRLIAGISYEPLSIAEQKALLERAGLRAGWNDPEMDVYDQLDSP